MMEQFPSLESEEKSPEEKHSEWMEEMIHRLKGAGVGLVIGAGIIAVDNVAKALGLEISDGAIGSVAVTQSAISTFYYLTHMGKNKKPREE